MKNVSTWFGLALIILGLVALGYREIKYTKQQNIAQIGSFQITTSTQKNIYLPPLADGLAIIAGIVLMISGRRTN